MSGPAPFGYESKENRLRIVEVEAAIRKKVFLLFVRHRTKSAVAGLLNAEGQRTRSGTIFSAQTIGRYLTDPIVLGVEGMVERIVEDELWQRCQDILAEQKAAGGAKRAPRHLFAGLLFCSCGQKMYVPSSSKKYVCSDCRSKIVKTDLEAVFVEKAKSEQMVVNSDLLPLLNSWGTLSFETKREVVEAVCDRLDHHRDNVLTIHFADI